MPEDQSHLNSESRRHGLSLRSLRYCVCVLPPIPHCSGRPCILPKPRAQGSKSIPNSVLHPASLGLRFVTQCRNQGNFFKPIQVGMPRSQQAKPFHPLNAFFCSSCNFPAMDSAFRRLQLLGSETVSAVVSLRLTVPNNPCD